MADFSLVMFAGVLRLLSPLKSPLKSTSFLQSTSSLHSYLPPSNQQLMDRTKSPPLFFFSIICLNWIQVTKWKKRSVATSFTFQLQRPIYITYVKVH